MAVQDRKKPMKSQRLSILWVSFTILDTYLHKTAFFHILSQLSELGHKPTLVAVRSKTVPRIEHLPMRIISIPLRYMPAFSPVMFAIGLVFFLPVYIVVFKPDFVIFDPEIHILSAFPVFLISKLRRVRLILDIRTTPVEIVGFRGFLRRFCFSFSVLLAKKLFDGITIITPLMKKEVCTDFGLNPEKVGVWTSGVSDTLFNPGNPGFAKEELRKNLGIAENFVILYHGVFTATRGLTETVEAIKILKRKYPTVVFFLLGTGAMAAKLRALIQEEALQENVILHNPVDQSEVPKFINMCDVCIVPLPNNPYWRHQSPLKLLECLAMGKFVILTDIPAHRSIVGETKCGLYTASVNPAEIAKAIEYAYINKERLEEWGKTGRKIIKEKYTWVKVAKDLENYLLSIK